VPPNIVPLIEEAARSAQGFGDSPPSTAIFAAPVLIAD